MSKEKPDSAQPAFFTGLDSEHSSALGYACSLQQACARVGFDWPDMSPVMDKVREEIEEIQQELDAEPVDKLRLQDEIGDAFFALVNLARHAGISPDDAIASANNKFRQRFEFVARSAKAGKGDIQQYSLEELEAFWVQAKDAQRSAP